MVPWAITNFRVNTLKKVGREGFGMAKKTAYDLVVVALLASLAGVFQVLNGVLGIPTGWGMTIDLVAVPILLAFFLFGFELAMWVLVLTAIVITVISPTSWIGASMKFTATLPMLAIPAFYLLSGRSTGRFAMFLVGVLVFSALALVLAGQLNLALRPIVDNEMPGGTLILGLAPIILFSLLSLALLYVWKANAHKLSSKPMQQVGIVAAVLIVALVVRGLLVIVTNYYYAGPVFLGMPTDTFMKAVPWYLIAGWNAFQGILEFGVAWLLAYNFGFAKRYGKW